MDAAERIDITAPDGQRLLLQSIEFVHFKMLDVWSCPRCGGVKPNHDEGCELAASIAQDLEITAMLDEEEAAREADPKLLAEYESRTWRRVVMMEISRERQHQIEDNDYTLESDDGQTGGEIARAAAATIFVGSLGALDRAWFDPDAPATERSQYGWKLLGLVDRLWPEAWGRMKLKGRRQDLIRGIAMGVAEVERIDRAANRAMDAEASRNGEA